MAEGRVRVFYYPGCSLGLSARPYDLSLRAVARVLGVELVEARGWVCCGGWPCGVLDQKALLAQAAPNLALAKREGLETFLAPCSGCYGRMASAARSLGNGEGLKVRHPLDLLVEEVGLSAIRSKVVRPLRGLRVACYYGCYLSRPPELTGHARPFRPRTLDELAEALGAKAVPFRQKTRCCGGPLLQSHPEVALALTRDLLEEARSLGAECLLSVCPLCSLMLDSHQASVDGRYGGAADLPVLYFTQLMGLAFGLPFRGLGLYGNVVSPRGIWEKCRSLS